MMTLPDPDVPPASDPDVKKTEGALDEALKESFPASDPVAIDIEHPAKAEQARQ